MLCLSTCEVTYIKAKKTYANLETYDIATWRNGSRNLVSEHKPDIWPDDSKKKYSRERVA
jgi:DNA-binding transcriptional regulator YhcF (GntR family)